MVLWLEKFKIGKKGIKGNWQIGKLNFKREIKEKKIPTQGIFGIKIGVFPLVFLLGLCTPLFATLTDDGFNLKIGGGEVEVPIGKGYSTINISNGKLVLTGSNRVSYLKSYNSDLEVKKGCTISYLEGTLSKFLIKNSRISAILLKFHSMGKISNTTTASISITDTNLSIIGGIVASLIVGKGATATISDVNFSNQGYSAVKVAYLRPGQIIVYPSGRLIIDGKYTLSDSQINIKYSDGSSTTARILFLKGATPETTLSSR